MSGWGQKPHSRKVRFWRKAVIRDTWTSAKCHSRQFYDVLKSYFIFISQFRRTSGGPGTPSVVPRRRIMLFQQIIRPRAGWERRAVFDLAALTFSRNSLSMKCLSAPARTSKVPNSFDQSPKQPAFFKSQTASTAVHLCGRCQKLAVPAPTVMRLRCAGLVAVALLSHRFRTRLRLSQLPATVHSKTSSRVLSDV